MATFNKARVARWLAGCPGSSKYFGPPRGYVDSIRNLSEKECRLLARLKEARLVEHCLPELDGYPDLEAQIRKSFLRIEEPEQNLYSLPNARILGANYFHPLITNRDRFVLDQAAHELQQSSHPAHYALRLPQSKEVPEVTFSLASRWSDNYWHWLFDCIGKWLLIEKTNPGRMPSIGFIAGLNLEQYAFKTQSLEALGVAEDRIVDIKASSHFEFENLLVADLPSSIPYPEMDVIGALREAFLGKYSAESLPKKVYISRGKSGSRRVVNEPELEETLNDFGFQKVYLEDLSFLQQVTLFQNATAIFGQHGAGFTNLIFSTAGAQVFELFEPEFVNPCYAILADKLGLDYKILFNSSAQRPTPTFHWKNIPVEVVVDCKVIREALIKNLT